MSERIARVNKLITKELAAIIKAEIELPAGVLVTVTRTDASVDLSSANVYLSVLPERQAPSTFRRLTQARAHLQRLLNRRLHMKTVPYIRFKPDHGQAQAARIDQLLQDEQSPRADQA